MEDEFLAEELIDLINLHFCLRRNMRRNLPEPDKHGFETLLIKMVESLAVIRTYKEFYRASKKWEALSVRIMDAIDDQVDSEFPP